MVTSARIDVVEVVNAVELVEVAEVGGPTDAESAGDVDVLAGPGPRSGRLPLRCLGRWGWWRAADDTSRRLAAVAAAGALVVLAVVGATVVTAPRVRTTTRTVLTPSAISVDASGCPTRHRCVIGPAAESAGIAVAQWFPSARIVVAEDTADALDAHVYLRSLVLSQGGLTVRLLAQCVPGAAEVTPAATRRWQSRQIDTALLPDGEPRFLRERTITRLSTTTAGLAGCSVLTEASDSETGNGLYPALPEQAIGRLAADPRLTLTP